VVPALDDDGQRIWYWYGEDRSKGYYDPWPWADRAAGVSINGRVVDEQRLFTGSFIAGE
jgi:hypothetical protein